MNNPSTHDKPDEIAELKRERQDALRSWTHHTQQAEKAATRARRADEAISRLTKTP